MARTKVTAVERNSQQPDWTPAELRQLEANSMDPDVFAKRIFEQIENAPALLSHEQMDQIESAIQRDSFRRAALAFATSTGAHLCQRIEKDRTFAVASAEVYTELAHVIARCHGLIELLEGIRVRLMVALCGREDMDSLFTDVRKDFGKISEQDATALRSPDYNAAHMEASTLAKTHSTERILIDGFEPISVGEIESTADVAYDQAETMSTIFRCISRLTDDREIKKLCEQGALQAELQANDIDVIRERAIKAGLDANGVRHA